MSVIVNDDRGIGAHGLEFATAVIHATHNAHIGTTITSPRKTIKT